MEASSGETRRRRLNRGGDRQANPALCTIVIARLRWDTRTRSHVERRVTEGRTRREAVRCLKHYVAREICQALLASRKQSRDQSLPVDIHRGICADAGVVRGLLPVWEEQGFGVSSRSRSRPRSASRLAPSAPRCSTA
ncbi:transposase [Streptomyces sp. NPDC093094]|uniref:transposase n=1 Tax=Streptomyces sp. NPDC093094 TaxID=3366026 RepID=UPI00380E8052